MAEKEYIERGAAIEMIRKDLPNVVNYHRMDAIECLEIAPAADVIEVRHGKWKKVYRNKIATVYECSNCQHLSFGTSEYCICGAKMDGGRKEQK